jgi:hypothetical protein
MRRALGEAVSFKPAVPFIVSAFAPLPLYVAGLIAAGIVGLDVALEALTETRRSYDNGLAYVLKVRGQDLRVDTTFWNRSRALAARYGI